MAEPVTVNDFVVLVCKSGLADERRVDAVLSRDVVDQSDPRQCATALVRANLLTPFQAKHLLAGKYRGLCMGAYHILSPLGRGGMGVVYLARHPGLGRKAAVKVLPADKAQDRLTLERFLREARSAAALDHPNIVRLFDIGQESGVHYLVMEYVEGTTLQARLAADGPLPHDKAAEYIAQVAAGLQHAHERGFVHRDIKPSNLIETKDGTVKILDMGLARSCQTESDNLTGILGSDQSVSGTVDFVSPEQALNQPVDARSDIYSLGATFYTLVAGHPPFGGTTAQKLVQHQVQPPVPLADKFPRKVPAALSQVVNRMMAKQPPDRYQSAAEVIEALGPWLPAETTGNISREQTRGVPTPEPKRPAAVPDAEADPPADQPPGGLGRRRLMLAGGAAGCLAVGLGVVAFAGLFSGKPKPPAGPTAGAAQPPSPVAPPTDLEPNPNAKYDPVPFGPAATATTARSFFLVQDEAAQLPSYGRLTVKGIPFDVADPQNGGVNNVILLGCGQGEQSKDAPESVTLPVGRAAATLYFLGGVGGWVWPHKPWNATDDLKGRPVVRVTLTYDDGRTEAYEWLNGVHYVDHISPSEIPGAEFAVTTLGNHKVRLLALTPRRQAVIRSVEFAKAEVPYAAPVVFAVTVKEPEPSSP